jgi:hypothetical protein
MRQLQQGLDRLAGLARQLIQLVDQQGRQRQGSPAQAGGFGADLTVSVL